MSKIKTYNLFLESNKEVDIYEFANMLKGWQTSLSEVKRHSEKFIGPGIYDRVEKLVNQMIEVLNYVDIEHIKESLYDVFDEFPNKSKRVHLSVLYSNPDRLKEPIEIRYTGSISVYGDKEKSKKYIICHILLDMLNPTFRIGYPPINIRETDDQIDVTDPKWNCVNFNIDNYDVSKKEGKFVKDGPRSIGTFIPSLELDKLRKYNIENFFQCYSPGIYIELYDEKYMSSKFNIKEIESLFDKYSPHILHDVEYENVLWQVPREGRRFDETTYDIYDYTLKVLLKM